MGLWQLKAKFRAGSLAKTVILTRSPSSTSPVTPFMASDGLSSPPAPYSSLPSSSIPLASTNDRSTPRTNPRSSPAIRQQPAGALAFDDDEAEEEQDGDASAARKRRRARGQISADVPIVKDAVGESVAESFEAFLKGWVHHFDQISYAILSLQ